MGIVIDVPNLYYIVYDILSKIPHGKITSYKEIAKALGDIKAARAVGQIVSQNKWPEKIPCYKVIHSNGSIGKYSAEGGQKRKKQLLTHEGAIIRGDKVINISEMLWSYTDMGIFPVLESLKRQQEYLAFLAQKQKPLSLHFKNIAACDIAYLDKFPEIAISCCILADFSSIKLVSISLLPLFFPYIPGYLAFREGSPILAAIENLICEKNVAPDLVILDGHGLLHPRRFGIATHIGLLLNKPSIGVAKSLLVGKVDTSKKCSFKDIFYYPVYLDGEIMGYCVEKSKRRIYVSPGYKIDVEQALSLILNLEWRNRRVPDLLAIPHDIVTRIRQSLKNYLLSSLKNKELL